MTSVVYLNKIISKNDLNNLTTVNIGVGFLKESLLNKVNGLNITSFDVDRGFISISNQLNERLNLDNDFVYANLLTDSLGKFIDKKFDLAKLIQMD